jgi:hypothetical protein
MTVGGILGEAWHLYTRFFTRFFAVAAIVYLVVNLVNAVLGTVIGLTVLTLVITWGVSLVGTFWLQGALVHAVADVRDGKIDSTIGQLFQRVRPQLWTLLGAGILAGITVGLGFVLLIVPGLIFLTWWCLVVPVIVVENRGITESFGRSRELVRGHGWTALGVVLISAVASAIASGVIDGLFSTFLSDFFRYWIGGTIASAVVGPFVAIALTVMFFRLQEARAGGAPPQAVSDMPAAT